MNKNKTYTIFFILGLLFLACFTKAIYIVFSSQESRGSIKKQSQKIETNIENASQIISTDNEIISKTTKTYNLAIYKPDLKQGKEEIEKILDQDFIKKTESKLLTTFWQNNSQLWVELKTPIDLQNIKKYKNIPGIQITQNIQRKFFFSQPIYQNIYYFYQRKMGDSPSYSWLNQDALGQTKYRPDNFSTTLEEKENIKVSINTKFQNLLTEALKDGVNRFKGQSASGIILETKTGAILAAEYINYLAKDNRISFAQDLFEPGSIFKPITIGIALETKKINENHLCTMCSKPLKIYDATITNYDNQVYPNSSLGEILKNSDNIALSEIGLKIGAQSFQEYIKKLNLDTKLGTDLPALSVPIIKRKPSKLDLATNSFGQGIAISQLHMIAAFNSIANRGQWVEPHINLSKPIKKITVFSESTVNTIDKALKYATQNGKAKQFNQENLDFCGKSGTAQIAIAGNYKNTKTNASYIGYFPCQNPKYTMVITINEPKSSPWGATTAAPIWYELAKKIYPQI